MPAGAVEGFEELMAGLLAGSGEPPPQIRGQGQAQTDGGLIAQPSPVEGEALLEPRIEGLGEIDGHGEGVSSLGSQLAAASLPPAPAAQPADLTVAPAGPPMEIATTPPPQPLPASALASRSASTENLAADLQDTAAPLAPLAPLATPGQPTVQAPQATGSEPAEQARSVDNTFAAAAKMAEPAQTATSPPLAAGVKVTAEAPGQGDIPAPAAQTQAAASAGQSAAQTLLASALPAGLTGLRATQSGPQTAATSPADPGSDRDADGAAPAAAAKAAAKPVFGAPPPSPFALTGGPAPPITAKAEPVIAMAVQVTASEVTPVAAEATTAGELDAPDLPGSGQIAAGLGAGEFRDPSRVAATPATVADLAAQVARKLEGRSTHFDIQLTPEGLGKVDVRVDIDAQGRLTAAMAFDTPQAASEMRGRSGELVRALEQAGFDMSGGLSFSSPQDQGGGGRFAGQTLDREAWQDRAFQNAMGVADEADAAVTTARAYQPRLSATGVDVRI